MAYAARHRLNATDVNVQFDQNSTTKQEGKNFYGNVRDTDQVIAER